MNQSLIAKAFAVGVFILLLRSFPLVPLVEAAPHSPSAALAAVEEVVATHEPVADVEGTPVARWLQEKGVLFTFLAIALLGLGLNLTPCVYPLLSVTVAYFGGQHKGQPRRVLGLATVYVVGIALTFSILGVAAALSGSLFGGALQTPYASAFVALVLVTLALSSFGFYTIQPPYLLMRLAGGSRGGVVGALFMGLTMGIVAAPCVGPVVVGLLLFVGSRQDPILGFLMFFTLALGLGLPYLALATLSGSLPRLPRSGEWLQWIERFFGFVLLGTALYFLDPLLPAQTSRLLFPAFFILAGIYLGFVERSGRSLRLFPWLKRSVGMAAVVLALWPLVLRQVEGTIRWQPFSPHLLVEARQQCKPAVVDVRADWCLPCKEMDRTTFVDPRVAEKTSDFVMLQADVTHITPEVEERVKELEVLGVPTTLFIDRSGKERKRLIGYVSPERFLNEMAAVREKTGSCG